MLEDCNTCTSEERKSYFITKNITLLQTIEITPGETMTWDATHELLKKGYYISINIPVNKTL